MNKFRQILSANIFLLRKKSVILRRSSGALGDNLMLSFLAREIKKKYPRYRIAVETTLPELFKNNPNIEKIYTEKVAAKYHKIKYSIEQKTEKHILDQIAENFSSGLINIERKMDIFLSDEEILQIRDKLPANYIVIVPVGKYSFASNRKDWGFDRFAELRESLSDIEFVQIGSKSDPLLSRTNDFRGLPIRLSAAVVYSSMGGVFLEGGLMHLANAVDKPSVIIYGGAVSPQVSGYDMHKNINTSPPCSPCFTSHQAMEECDTMICMKGISVDQVTDVIRALIQNEK